jgi:uncharacterized protein YecE (DUF72 family)
VDLCVGTSGYNYKEWKGSFYPERFPDKEMLGFYSGHFNSVEINNTFYRVPKPEVVAAWAEQVPPAFRFVLKATRRITHLKRLKGVEEEVEYFFSVASHLGGRMGALLFQLPPTSKKDMERLATFVALLPEGTRAAMEFRHDSWFDDEVFECLRARDIALCFAHEDDDAAEDVDRKFVSTATWGYMRLRGSQYTPAEMSMWSAKAHAQDWQRAFVFFKHESEGLGPKLATSFIESSSEASGD